MYSGQLSAPLAGLGPKSEQRRQDAWSKFIVTEAAGSGRQEPGCPFPKSSFPLQTEDRNKEAFQDGNRACVCIRALSPCYTPLRSTGEWRAYASLHRPATLLASEMDEEAMQKPTDLRGIHKGVTRQVFGLFKIVINRALARWEAASFRTRDIRW